ncbi:MAG TPA: hypothetical protein VGR44_01935 [Methylomirabilota bacterium]|jgi:hypothetical protein|nr:hypothetical protein [Methylomirabilota bacterium]
MKRGSDQRAWYRRPIELYDRLYRLWHGLDRPGSQVGPAIRLELRRRRRPLELADGTRLAPGDRIGVIHLNNEEVAALHTGASSIRTVGLRFRRLFIASLRELARRAEPGGPLADVQAFAATTIFHHGLGRLGFEPPPTENRTSVLGVFYQRALLACLHPAGSARLGAATYAQARRLWISRRRLIEGFARARSGSRMIGSRRRDGTLRGTRRVSARSLEP